MELLNPALAWFALGGSIPVIIHLLHRQRFRRVRWGAMQFLLNAIKKTQRRIRLENLILLLIRILIMILLAMAIARPLLRESVVAMPWDSNTNYIFVIDNSYSMEYKRAKASALELAKQQSLDLLKKIQFSTEDTFTLILMSEYPEMRLRSIKRKETARSAIEEIRSTDYGTSYVRTMQLIERAVKLSENVDKRVYVFTDMQRNAWTAQGEEERERFRNSLKNISGRDKVRFYLIDVGEPDPVNTALVGVSTTADVITTRSKANFTVQLYNFSDVDVDNLTLSMHVNGDNKAERTVSLDRQSMRYETFDFEFLEAGPYWIQFKTEPRAFLSKDDQRYLALEVKDAINVLMVDGNPGPTFQAATTFLQLALDPSGAGAHSPFKLDVKTPETFPAEDLARYDAVVLGDVQFLPPEKIERLSEFVKDGGGLLVGLGSKVDRDFYNREFWKDGEGLLPAKLTDVRGRERVLVETGRAEPVLLGDIRIRHPLFKVFEESGLEDMLYHVEFCQYWGVEEYAEEDVLAKFKDILESPAFIESRFGNGRVLLYTSTLNKDWALLPARNAYVPIMVNAVRRLAARPLDRKNVYIGDTIFFSFPVEKWKPEFRLSHVAPGDAGIVSVTADPPEQDQRRVSIAYPAALPPEEAEDAPARRERELRNEGLRTAGVYALEYADATEEDKPLSYFAVNLGPEKLDNDGLNNAEANLERISEEELRQRYPDFKFEMLFKKAQAPDGEIDTPSSNLWKIILLAVLLLLLSESVLACIFGRRKE